MEREVGQVNIFFLHKHKIGKKKQTLFVGGEDQRKEPNVRILVEDYPQEFFRKVFSKQRFSNEEIKKGAQGVVLTNVWYSRKGRKGWETSANIAIKISVTKKETPVREAKIASKIKNPHVVKVITYGYGTFIKLNSRRNYTETYKFGYVALEMCNLGSLEDVMNNEKEKLDEKSVYIRFEQLCQGLKAIHEAEVKHHDLKPQNIMAHKELSSERCILKIGDFGFAVDRDYIAQFINVEKDGSLVMVGKKGKRGGHGFGTRGYFPPELMASVIEHRISMNELDDDEKTELKKIRDWMKSKEIWKDYLDPKTKFSGMKADIFSMGLVLFYLITGRGYNFRINRSVLEFESASHKLKKERDELVDLVDKMTKLNFQERLTIDEVLSHPWMQDMKKKVRKKDIQRSSKIISEGFENKVATDFEVFRELFLLEMKKMVCEEVKNKLEEVESPVSYFLDNKNSVFENRFYLEEFFHRGPGRAGSKLTQDGEGNEGSVVNYLLGYAVMKKSCYLYAGFLKQLNLRSGMSQEWGGEIVNKMMNTKAERQQLSDWHSQMTKCLAKMKMFKKSLSKLLPTASMQELENQTPNNQLFAALTQWLKKYIKDQNEAQLLYYHAEKIMKTADERMKEGIQGMIKKSYKKAILNFGTFARALSILLLNLGYLTYTYTSNPARFEELFGEKLRKKVELSKDHWILDEEPEGREEDYEPQLDKLKDYLTLETFEKTKASSKNKNSKKFKKYLKEAFDPLDVSEGAKSIGTNDLDNSCQTVLRSEYAFRFEVKFEDWIEKTKKVSQAISVFEKFLNNSVKSFNRKMKNLKKFGVSGEEFSFIEKRFKDLKKSLDCHLD